MNNNIPELKKLLPNLEDLIPDFTKKSSKEYAGQCLVGCGGGTDRFFWTPGSLSGHCRQCEKNYDNLDIIMMQRGVTIVDLLKEYNLYDEPDKTDKINNLKKKKDKKKQPEQQKSLPAWEYSSANDERIIKYFASRNIHFNEDFPVPPALRFSEFKDKDTGLPVLSIIAAVTNINNDTAVRATHRTFLDPDLKKINRIMKGDIKDKGRGVWFHRKQAKDATQLIIGEGLETVLSAMLTTGITGVAGLDSGKMEGVELPESVVELFILVDEDILKDGAKNGYAGQKVSLKLAKQFEKNREGNIAWLVTPSDTCFTDSPVKKDFNDLSVDENQKRFVCRERFSDIDWKPPEPLEQDKKEKAKVRDDIEAEVSLMNKNHAAVLAGGSFVILRENKNPVSNSIELDFLKIDTFRNFYGNKKVWVQAEDKKKQVSIPKLWLEHQDRRTYDGVVFDPGYKYPAEKYYNLFTGFSKIEPIDTDISLFHDHILNIACNGRKDKRDYLMRWFQRALLDPGGTRPGVALVFHGGRGCGKGTVMDWFSPLFSPHYVHLTDGNMLTGKFNKHLSGNILCFADEAVFAKDKREENKLKGLITEKKLFMEAKNFDAVAIDSYINIVMASNNDHVVGVGRDERRYSIFAFSNSVAQNGDYFNALDDLLSNGGTGALLFHLLNTKKYDHVDLRKPPPTKALDDQKQQSLDSTESFWMDVLERGYIISPSKNGEDSAVFSQINTDNKDRSVHGMVNFEWEKGLYVRMSFIYSEYLLFCREKKENYPVSNKSFWNKTKRKDSPQSVFKNCMVVVNRNNAKCIIINEIEDYKKEFSESVCCLSDVEKNEDNDSFVPFDGQF